MPLSATLAAIALAQASGTAFENLPALDARIAAIAPGAIPLDPRIRLAACPQPAEIDPPASGSLAVRCPALGWRMRIAIAQTDRPSSAILVRRGEDVELVYLGSGFALGGVGTAMEDAAKGQPVRVKIPTSPAPVTAIATEAGVATISR